MRKISPSVSVIIPIYKAEKYIEKCVRSLFGQTLSDIEFIFVDDHSPDKSISVLKKILEAFPSRKSQVKIISLLENKGLANARTVGLMHATGLYVAHCDSDDWVDLDLYDKMFSLAQKENSDIVVCDVLNEYKDKRELKSYDNIPRNPRSAITNIHKNFFDMYNCNKLVRRSVYIENKILPFSGINMWEDNGLMYRIFYYSNKLSKINDSLYHYNRMNENALTYTYGQEQTKQMIECAERLTDFFRNDESFLNTVRMIQFCAKVNLITDDCGRVSKFKQLFPGVEDYANQIDKRAFSIKGRIRRFFVTHHMTYFFVLLFKLKNLIS